MFSRICLGNKATEFEQIKMYVALDGKYNMIVIIGGGVIGLSLSFQLLKAGKKVTIVEQGQIGHGASWAAAGYLEPSLGKTETARIEWQSLKQWPQFVDDVQRVSGIDVDYQNRGQLRIAYPDNEQDIRSDFDLRKSRGWQAEEVSAEQLRRLEPSLANDISWAAYLPQVCWVDGRKLCRALALAITKLGGTVLENTPVERLVLQQDTVVGVETADQEIPADAVVIAAGYQSGLIEKLPEDMPKSYGLKGIILTLAGNPDTPVLHHLIKRPDGVLCPRNDGRILVGVTRDADNSSPHAEAGSVANLLQSGIQTMPSLENMALIETVVGFRPYIRETSGSSIGESAQTRNLYHSLGHGSDGFLRAPYYAQALADQITGVTKSG